MIPVGQPYKAAGPINLRSVATTLILGTVVALLAAMAVWAWEISPIPTLVIITPILQGVLIGVAMTFMIGRLRMRNPKLVGLIAFACGLLSVAMVHYGHYMHMVEVTTQELKASIAADKTIPADKKAIALAKLSQDPRMVMDPFLVGRTGHPGLVGSMILRAEIGVHIKNMELTGWGVAALWGFEALAVALAAWGMSAARAAEPFCEDCGDWCLKKPGSVHLHTEAGPFLAEAVRVDSPQILSEVITTAPPAEGSLASGTTLHVCGDCGQTFVDVWHQVMVKPKKNEIATKTLVTQIRVSPEVAAILQTGKPETIEELAPELEVEEQEPTQ